MDRASGGLVCEQENPQALANAMIGMSALSKQDLRAMGARSRQYYLGHLSFAIAGTKMDAVFEDVVIHACG